MVCVIERGAGPTFCHISGPHLTPEALAKAQEPCPLPAGMAFCGLYSECFPQARPLQMPRCRVG